MMAVLRGIVKHISTIFYWAVPQNISREIDLICPLPEKTIGNGRHSVDRVGCLCLHPPSSSVGFLLVYMPYHLSIQLEVQTTGQSQY